MQALIPSPVPACLSSLLRPSLALSPSVFESLYMRALIPTHVLTGFRQSGSRPGQPVWTITGLTTRVFRRPLLLPTPRVIEYSDDIGFLFHPQNCQGEMQAGSISFERASLPDNSITWVAFWTNSHTQDLHQWGRANFGPTHTTEPPGHKPLVVNVIVVGPFEEEEEETGLASDVVKVQGEDPDTLGYLRGDRVRLGRWRSRIVDASPLTRSPWIPGTVPNIVLIKQSNTRVNASCHTYERVVLHMWSHASFIFVTWLIHMCDMAHWCVWHDSFMYMIWLIHKCDMTHWYVYDTSSGRYGVATISKIFRIIGLFCKRALYKRPYSAKETYDLNRLLIEAAPYFNPYTYKYERVVSHIRICHVTHMNLQCHK